MEKKQRVPKGEKYWYLAFDCDGLYVEEAYDNRLYTDSHLFEIGNYFKTKEEAETMARKLCAVLKGADVIEMPSEEELHEKSDELSMMFCTNYPEYGIDTEEECYNACTAMINFLKSKIVK